MHFFRRCENEEQGLWSSSVQLRPTMSSLVGVHTVAARGPWIVSDLLCISIQKFLRPGHVSVSVAMVRTLDLEVQQFGVKTYLVSPGYYRTRILGPQSIGDTGKSMHSQENHVDTKEGPNTIHPYNDTHKTIAEYVYSTTQPGDPVKGARARYHQGRGGCKRQGSSVPVLARQRRVRSDKRRTGEGPHITGAVQVHLDSNGYCWEAMKEATIRRR